MKILVSYYIDFYLHLASEIFSLIEDVLIVADNSGKVYQLSLSHVSDEGSFLCQQLPSSHQPGKMMYLFRLCGMMSRKGFLSSISSYTKISMLQHRNYVNLSTIGSIPCVVLLGLRAGYGSMFQAEQITSPSLYFTTWAFTDSSLCA